MPEKSFAYVRCLFCVVGHEEDVVKRITNAELGVALHPKKTEPYFRNGCWRDVQKSLLPGYVFVYTNEPAPISLLYCIQDVIRVLTYDAEDRDGYLNDRDRALAEWLYQENGVVDNLNAVAEGDYVRIVDGLLSSLAGKVLRVNKRKRIVNVELCFAGSIHTVWLGFQYIAAERP